MVSDCHSTQEKTSLVLFLISLFIISLSCALFSSENWNEILYDSWKATSWVAPLYFISLVVLGTMIILNLFLAILLSRFDGNEQLGLGDQIHPEVGVLEKHKNRFAQSTIAGLLHRFGEKFHLRIGQKCGFIQTWTQSLVDDKRFEGTLTLVIVMSSIILALDSPLADPNTPMVEILSMLNSAITTIFVCEFLVKLLAYGPVKYLQDWWNVLDFVAVVASILELFSVKGGKSLRVLRTLRVLRPLKMIHRFPGIKLVVDALLLSMPSVGNVGESFSLEREYPPNTYHEFILIIVTSI